MQHLVMEEHIHINGYMMTSLKCVLEHEHVLDLIKEKTAWVLAVSLIIIIDISKILNSSWAIVIVYLASQWRQLYSPIEQIKQTEQLW